MIINLDDMPVDTRARYRIRHYRQSSRASPPHSCDGLMRQPKAKVELRKIMFAMPFLFAAGVCTGLGISLAFFR